MLMSKNAYEQAQATISKRITRSKRLHRGLLFSGLAFGTMLGVSSRNPNHDLMVDGAIAGMMGVVAVSVLDGRQVDRTIESAIQTYSASLNPDGPIMRYRSDANDRHLSLAHAAVAPCISLGMVVATAHEFDIFGWGLGAFMFVDREKTLDNMEATSNLRLNMALDIARKHEKQGANPPTAV